MKYLVAADDIRLDAKLSKRFVHANAYLIVDADTEEITAHDGNACRDPFKFADLHLPHSGLSGIITCNIGPRAFQHANETGLPVFLLRNVTVKRAIELVSTGNVEPVEQSSLKRSIHERRHRQQDANESTGVGRMTGMRRGKHLGGHRMKHRH